MTLKLLFQWEADDWVRWAEVYFNLAEMQSFCQKSVHLLLFTTILLFRDPFMNTLPSAAGRDDMALTACLTTQHTQGHRLDPTRPWLLALTTQHTQGHRHDPTRPWLLAWLPSTLWASAVTSLRPWLPARLPSSLRVTGMTPLGSVRPFYLALLDTCFCTQDSLPDLSWHLFCKAAPCSPHHCITTIVFFYIHLSWNSWNNESDIILFLHHVSVTMPLCCGCYITLYVTESDDTK